MEDEVYYGEYDYEFVEYDYDGIEDAYVKYFSYHWSMNLIPPH